MIHTAKRVLNSLAMALFFSASAFAQHSNCSVAPYENTITQPDGSKITLKALGNEAVHYLETAEGFTVLKNAAGYFEYATADEKGNLTTSGVVARNGQQQKTGIPHLRYSPEQQNMMMQLFEQTHPTEKALGKAGQNPFPPSGTRKLIVILVEYPDLRATLPKANFELLLNQPNYNGTGSFRDFYLATSNGKLDVTSTVYGWVMAANNYQYYGKESSANYGQATRQLLLGALQDANDSFNVDYSDFDNDGDGYVDGVIIMHAGRGAEESSAPSSGDFIWSFRSTLQSSQQPTYDGVKVAAYAMFPEKRYSSGGIVGIGVMCHEFGHLLDLPDLYSTQYLNEGAGNYSLMAGGCWLNNERTPCVDDAWSRIAMGWVSPTVISTQKLYSLPKAVADSDMVYRVNTSRPNEYYLLENRQRKGFDKYLPSKGLAIWHINTNFAKVLSLSGSNNVNNDSSQLGVGLIQADGQRHLERNSNRGDANDMYPLANKKAFGPSTVPASNLQYKIGGVRQPSNLSFTDITQLADSGIIFEFGAPTSASFDASKISGCAPLTVSLTNNSFGADTYSWTFGTGDSSADESPTFIFNSEGDYNVTLIVYKNGVAMDTAKQAIKVYGSPTPSYTYVVSDTNYSVTFTNTSANANAYQWLFNGTTSSNNANPIITMSGPGSLIVKLSAYNAANCSKMIEDTIMLYTLGINNRYENKLQLTGYPNPFSNEVSVSFSIDKPDAATLEVFDMVGAKVYEARDQQLNAGLNSLSIKTDHFSNGIYFIRVNAKDTQGWVKIVKQ
ncbi:MAG: M6 family metalloprotease domain-containing protein [Bacteroidota bacterium]